MQVRFTVLGEPKGKGRPRATVSGGYAKVYTPKDTVMYENLVRLEYRQQCGDYMFPEGAVLDMRIAAFYSIPKSASKKKRRQMEEGNIRPVKKPDMDNVVKSIADSLNGVAYRDDTQIVDCAVRKFYSDKPRVVITIKEIEKNE